MMGVASPPFLLTRCSACGCLSLVSRIALCFRGWIKGIGCETCQPTMTDELAWQLAHEHQRARSDGHAWRPN